MKNKKQRPEYVAWEKVYLAQIAASENSIKCLRDELNATIAFVKSQKRLLKRARKGEENI